MTVQTFLKCYRFSEGLRIPRIFNAVSLRILEIYLIIAPSEKQNREKDRGKGREIQ